MDRDLPTDLVSVVIPTFNRASMVREAIRSVLDQKDAAFELIVVDDGSQDETPEVLASFGSSIRVLRQPNRGVSAARNLGVAAARGRWIAFLDSDDLWKPEKLRRQMEYLRNHPDCRICQTEEIWIQNGRRRNPRRYHRKPSGYCFDKLLERCLISPSAVMIRKDLLESLGGFDESLPACEDYDLWLRIGCRHPVGLVPEPLVVKRGGHSDQLSATIPALDRYRIRSMVKLLESGVLSPVQREQTVSVLARKAAIYAKGCYRRGRRAEGDRVLALAAFWQEKLRKDLPRR